MPCGVPSRRAFAALLVQLALWSQAGVLLRVLVSKLASSGCAGAWGPCVEGGGLFKDLPANALGSFIMGALASSSALGLAGGKALVALPASHPAQRDFELQAGLRTGFCGCLTTFAAWMLELVTAAISENQWFDLFFGLLVGLEVAICSYAAGVHLALYVDRWALGEDALAQAVTGRAAEAGEARGERAKESAAEVLLQEYEPDLPRLSPRASGAEAAALASAAPAESSSGAGGGARAWGDRAALAALLAATAGLAAGFALETEHTWLRQGFAGALMAPFGCLLRWALSRLNYRGGGRLGWAPGGTLAANALGAAATFGIQAALVRRGLAAVPAASGDGYWESLLLHAVQQGFIGALTTVSTLVAELAKLSAGVPETAHAYLYGAATLAVGVLTGIVFFGWAVWT
jgi:CrcB protein